MLLIEFHSDYIIFFARRLMRATSVVSISIFL